MFVALAIQHETCMCRLVICGLSGCTKLFTLYQKRQDFREIKITEHKICVWVFFTISAKTILILKRKERDLIINVRWSSCKEPVIFSDFN
jgi:hypothetical protein